MGLRGDIRRVSKVGVANANVDPPKGVVRVTADLDTLLTALYVLIDDHVIPSGQHRPGRVRGPPIVRWTRRCASSGNIIGVPSVAKR